MHQNWSKTSIITIQPSQDHSAPKDATPFPSSDLLLCCSAFSLACHLPSSSVRPLGTPMAFKGSGPKGGILSWPCQLHTHLDQLHTPSCLLQCSYSYSNVPTSYSDIPTSYSDVPSSYSNVSTPTPKSSLSVLLLSLLQVPTLFSSVTYLSICHPPSYLPLPCVSSFHVILLLCFFDTFTWLVFITRILSFQSVYN